MNKTVKTVIISSAVTFMLTRIGYGFILKPYYNEVTRKITEVNQVITEIGFYDVDEKTLADYAAAGLTLGVDDKYTNYYSKEQFEHFTDNLTNNSYVIGVGVSVNSENRIIVETVIEDSPAQKAGVKKGDIIIEVNSVKFNGDKLEEAVSEMRGDEYKTIEGTELDLKLLRDNEELDIKIVREMKKYQSVKYDIFENDIGYLRIVAFNSASEEDDGKDTYDEFLENLNILKDKGIKNLIIDLRNNPGGSLDVVNNIADELLPEGVITYTEDKYGRRVEYKSDKNQLDMPIVVLVNSNSASASEVLTGALKDYNKATIVGTKTFGKGIVQSVIPFDDGSGMSITTSKYFTPNGVCIHEIGIEPDIFVENADDFDLYDSPKDEDIQLQEAIKLLKK